MDNETYARRIATLARAAASQPAGDRGGSVKADIRRFLHTYADGRCALCGITTRLDAQAQDADRAEVSHVVSVGDSKRGIAPGNVFNGCRGCNLATSDKDLTRYLHLFNDVFAIPEMWPTFGQMASDRKKSDKGDESRKRREMLGFDF